MRSLLCALSLLAITGCSSAPVDLAGAPPVPVERIYNATLVQPDAGKVMVVVARDRGFVGGGCNTAVYWNGEKIAAIHQGEYITLYAPSGRHLLGHGPNPDGTGLCKYGSESQRRELEVVAEQGRPLKYRIAISSNGEPALMPTAF